MIQHRVRRSITLQAGSTASAIRATMMYSFIGTCKAFDVNPTEWFRYVIDNIGSYQSKSKDLRELLPSNYKNIHQ
ncbi:MAG: transposase domain-containing protein [Bacteroidales bacterium]